MPADAAVEASYVIFEGPEIERQAERTTDSLRGSDLFGRLGGEEFAMLLPSTGAEGAALMANRLRQKIAATPIPTSHGALNMTVSIGVAQMDKAIDDGIDTMLNRADKALYAAKNSGRNRVVYA